MLCKKEIGDTVFFWIGETYCQMPKEHFDLAFPFKDLLD
jgi:hypothetical protein